MKLKITSNQTFYSLILFFLLFQNIILNNLSIPGINYWDEIVVIFLSMLSVATLFKRGTAQSNSSETKIVLCIVGIILTGLLGNIIFEYAYSVEAIFRDIVNFIKFPMTFVSMCYLGYDKKMSEGIQKGFLNFLRILIYIIFILGIISLFVDIGMSQDTYRNGIRSFQFLFTHPTYLVVFEIFALAIFDAYEYSSFRLDLIISITVILTMRTKGIALIAVYLFLKYAGQWLNRLKVVYWIGAIIVVIATAYSKLEEYASWTTSPRETLYLGALELMRKCAPIGSGFATFASHLSGKFYSDVYDFIYIADGWVNGEATAVLGDAGFPYYMGQFGIIGTILFVILLWYVFKSCKNPGERYNFGVLILIAYILIALTSEAILINDGTIFGILLSFIAYVACTHNRELGLVENKE